MSPALPQSDPPRPPGDSVPVPEDSLPTAGERVGRYEVVRPLGRGGFAHTFLARHPERGCEVALKTLHGRLVTDPKSFQLFEREAQVLVGLRHRGVPEFVEFFRAEVRGTATAVLVMEYVEGRSLSQMIADGHSMAALQVLDFMLEMLGILDFLHTRVPPILHRDIKPANILMRPDGAPVLVDFGAVRNVFHQPGESGSTVVGTYGYMPHEQYLGQASPASDLYALGATFLHLVTGRPPSDFVTDEGRLAVPVELPVDEPMRGVIARLLEASPARRYPSAKAAREALLASPTRPASRPGAGTALVAAAPGALASLEPAPRPLRGVAAERYRSVAPSMWQLMEPTQSPDDAWGVVDVLALVFFSTITAGVLPILFLGFSQARKRRLRRFFREGEPALARIMDFRPEDLAFGTKLTRVRYEFEADGRTRRGSDTALPYIADRWREGEQIEILYIPERGYDSVIVSIS